MALRKQLSDNERMKKLDLAKAEFESVIKDVNHPLSKNYIFNSTYDTYLKALEGVKEAYDYLHKHGRYYTNVDKLGNIVHKTNPANGDFIKYMQQANTASRQLLDMIKVIDEPPKQTGNKNTVYDPEKEGL